MPEPTIATQILQLAEQLTTIAVLLFWLSAERRDNQKLWNIVSDLIRLRLRQVEDGDELQDEPDIFPTGKNSNSVLPS